MEEETIRIISLLPKMTLGRNKNENVRVRFSIPITFDYWTKKIRSIKSNGFVNCLKTKIKPLQHYFQQQQNHSIYKHLLDHRLQILRQLNNGIRTN